MTMFPNAHAMSRRISALAVPAILLALLLPAAVMAQSKTISDDMRAAALAYAETKKAEILKEQSKAAITALYKKLYGSGANKDLMRALGTVALSAEEINKLAENAANALYSGNPENVKAAASQVAIGLGQTLTTAIRDPQLRKDLAGALGSVDKVNEIAEVLGKAAGGDQTAAMEYAGRALIAATPAAGIFTAAESAIGVMKYARGKFVDAELEDLYRRYAAGDADTRAAIRQEMEVSGPYFHIIGERRRELEAEKIAAISRATVEPGEALFERLTRVTEREVVDGILESFAARVVRERQSAAALAASKQAQAEAEAMLEAFGSVVRNGYGKDWADTYSFNYDRFMQIVKQAVIRDGVLDPNDLTDVRAVSGLLATRMVYGADSAEYEERLKDFNTFRDLRSGKPPEAPPTSKQAAPPAAPAGACPAGSRERVEADRLWAEVQSLMKQKRQDAAMLALMERSVALCPDPARVKERNVWKVVINVADGVTRAAPAIKEAVETVK